MCNKEAEVYSRITGYYRPVKNWNEGKLEEYKARKTYDPIHSRLKKNHAAVQAKEEKETAEGSQASVSGLYLFTTKTCPNCRIADAILHQAAVPFQKIDAEEHAELVSAYGVRQAPTLIVVHGEQFEKYGNASEIKRFAEAR